MANPNIVNVTTILGNTSSNLISSNASPFATALINNPASSGKVFKINTIILTNRHGTDAQNASIRLYTQDDLGGSNTDIISTVSFPPDAAIVVIDKNSSIYLLEDKSIGAAVDTANTVVVTCSWEEIS